MFRFQYSSRYGRVVSALILFIVVAGSAACAAELDLSPDSPGSVTPAISKGDSVFVHGTATGHPAAGLQIWLIGTNYARVTNIGVGNDNSFEYEITESETQNLAAGQYFVLIQHPMMNGRFDITYNSRTGEVTNEQLIGGTGKGTKIFQLTGAGNLPAPSAASALLNAVSDQNIDDSFTTVTFSLQPSGALIDPIPEHTVGDRFTISGTTNLAAGDNLMVEITSSSFSPTSKASPGGFSGSSGMVQVQQGTGRLNTWSYDVDASTFRPDEYIVTVSAILQDVRESSTFTITEKKTEATTVVPVSTMSEQLPLTPGTVLPVSSGTQKTSAETAIVIFSLIISLVAGYAKCKK